MGELSDYGTRMGLFLTCMAFGALTGPPISGAINKSTGGFTLVGVYAGMCHAMLALTQSSDYSYTIGTAVVISAFLFALTRHMQLGRLRGKV